MTFHLGLHCLPKSQGDALIFSYIRRLGSFLGGLKILNFNILEVFKKMNIFWGMKIVCIFFFFGGGGGVNGRCWTRA